MPDFPRQSTIQRLSFILIILLLIIPHIMRSGTSPQALLIFEILGIMLLLTILSGDLRLFNIKKTTWIGILFGLSIPIIYLIPLPLAIWEQLPGRENFLPSIYWLLEKGQPVPWISLSLIPEKTVHALLAIIPVLAIFLGTVYQNKENIFRIVYILITIATIQALLGLIQYPITGAARGTYVNTTHYAAFMYVVLPFSLSLLVYKLKKILTYQTKTYADIRTLIILGILTLLIALAGILSTSRSGGFLVLSAIFISSALLFPHLGKKQRSILSTILFIIVLIVISTVNLTPVIQRFITLNPAEDLRWQIIPETIKIIQLHFPIGSGPGTFQEVFKVFQSIGMDREGFVNHAHNDYLELISETGIFGIIFIILAFSTFIQGWLILAKQPWNKIRFINSAAGIAFSLAIIHAFLNFNFHNPANAITFVCVLGVFLNQHNAKP